jgi:hypothetical protein
MTKGIGEHNFSITNSKTSKIQTKYVVYKEIRVNKQKQVNNSLEIILIGLINKFH